MTELLIIISIVLVGYIFSMATSFDDYFDKKKKGLKKVTKKGKTFIIVSIISILLYVIQYEINEAKNLREEEAQKIEKAKSDSIYHKRLEESNRLIINTFAAGLAKYSLKYNSANQTIERLIKENRDTVIVDGGEPFLSLCKENPVILSDTIGSYFGFNLNICNSEAPSKGIKAIVYVVSVHNNGHFSLSKIFNLFPTNAQMDNGARVTQQVLVPIEENIILCYFLVKGIWTNSSESKQFSIDQIYHYNLETKNSGGITAEHERQIRTFLKDKMN
jgi:hypothetical protein